MYLTIWTDMCTWNAGPDVVGNHLWSKPVSLFLKLFQSLFDAKPTLVKHAEKNQTSSIKSASDWHIWWHAGFSKCIHIIVQDEVAWKVCDVDWKVTGLTKRDQKIHQILFEQTNRALHAASNVQMSDSWHRDNLPRKKSFKTGWFLFQSVKLCRSQLHPTESQMCSVCSQGGGYTKQSLTMVTNVLNDG